MKALLAPWFYRNVPVQNGGPIARISHRKVIDAWNQPSFECYAYLAEEFEQREQHVYYGKCEGGGTASTLLEATHRAISEAIERWCFLSITRNTPELVCEYGFDIEPSTTGMAAFPALSSRHARRVALLEAIERWTVINWWNGNLATKTIESQGQNFPFFGVEIQTPFRTPVVILWRTAKANITSFGFACGRTRNHAIRKASVELVRNEQVLAAIPQTQESIEGSLAEKRLHWFAQPTGFQHFLKQVENSTSSQITTPEKPKLLIDKEVIGPWTKYARVWRCLLENTEWTNHRITRIDIFAF